MRPNYLDEFHAGNLVEIYLKLNHPLTQQHFANPQEPGPKFVDHFIQLPPLFSHLNFRLLEMLSMTQHGEFVTHSKKGKYETIVHLISHISLEFKLNNESELTKLKHLYALIRQIDSELWLSSKLQRNQHDSTDKSSQF